MKKSALLLPLLLLTSSILLSNENSTLDSNDKRAIYKKLLLLKDCQKENNELYEDIDSCIIGYADCKAVKQSLIEQHQIDVKVNEENKKALKKEANKNKVSKAFLFPISAIAAVETTILLIKK